MIGPFLGVVLSTAFVLHRVPAALPYFLSQRHASHGKRKRASGPGESRCRGVGFYLLFFLLVYLYFEMRCQCYWSTLYIFALVYNINLLDWIILYIYRIGLYCTFIESH